MTLSKDQLNTFHEDGYLVLPDFLGPDKVAQLRDRVVSMLNDFEYALTKFSLALVA